MCVTNLTPERGDCRRHLRDDSNATTRLAGCGWYLTNQKQGVSALGLQRVLGPGSYLPPWTKLHRLRRASVRPGREQLQVFVEVDGSYLTITDRQTPSHQKDARAARAR